MPWKETRVEQERMKFIAAWLNEDCDWAKSELCRAFGISRKIGYKWRARYEASGLEGLKDQSRAPKTHPNAVAPQVVERLLKLRRRHRFWGPRKIVAQLSLSEPAVQWPAVSTA